MSSHPSPAVWFADLQERLAAELGALTGELFRCTTWERIEGGGGRSRLIDDGAVIERGGINYSVVSGHSLPAEATAARPHLAGRSWEACGVSVVIHPRNPYCPTAHMNVRHFVARKENEADLWWFGGGMDLTPFYPFEDDVRHFHSTCKRALTPFGESLHARYKRWCDEYFFLAHRNEPRGVGGIFYDDLSEGGFDRCFALTRAVGEAFSAAYLPILAARRDTPYGERERNFQAYRRGRYVEFNLLSDRGTRFGLQSGGRTESILQSLPPVAQWRTDWQAEPGSPEARLAEFLVPQDWC